MQLKDFIYFNNKFDHNIIAGISTKDCSFSRLEIAKSIGFNTNSVAIPKQTHSNNVLYINQPGKYENCDGLITDNNDVLLSLQTADCIPIFMYDKINRLRGLIHAGWRGTVGGIFSNAISVMIEKKSDPKNIVVLLGPSICKNCFEVREDIIKNFDMRCIAKNEHFKYFVDLFHHIKLEGLNEKLENQNILFSKTCTFEDKNYCSFRRDGENAGRMFSYMGVNHELY